MDRNDWYHYKKETLLPTIEYSQEACRVIILDDQDTLLGCDFAAVFLMVSEKRQAQSIIHVKEHISFCDR